MHRRSVLRFGAGALAVAGATALIPSAFASETRHLAFINTHTGDVFDDTYWADGAYVPGALDTLKHVLRDHRNNETHDIDPRLFDQLYALSGLVGAQAPYQIISGYRSPATNAMLHAQSDGVASHSLHLEGRAIDIRVGGVDLARLRDAALSMQAGGVGFYPGSDFIHVDTGRVRRW